MVLTHTVGGCLAGEVQMDVPDEMVGVVKDQDTDERLANVSVIVYLTERQSIAIPGPEGTPRPHDRIVKVTHTGIDGRFKIDLREAKVELNANYPDKEFTIGQLVASKRGYLTLAVMYITPGSQIIKLRKRAK
jgi:hypothetical protein